MKKDNLEIELKLGLLSDDLTYINAIKGYIQKLVLDNKFQVVESWHDIQMDAIYYDTIDSDLEKIRACYRIRCENKNFIATVKCSQKEKDNFSKRIEINIPQQYSVPDLELLKNYPILKNIYSILHDKELYKFVETKFVRHCIKLNMNNSIIEIALDIGQVSSRNKSLPILEMELELIEGSINNLNFLQKKLLKSNLFTLNDTSKSKYKRGLELFHSPDM